MLLSLDGPGAAQEPTWLADVPAAMEFIAATEVAVIGFFQVSPLLAIPLRARNVLPQGNHSSHLLADGTALEVGVKGDSHAV